MRLSLAFLLVALPAHAAQLKSYDCYRSGNDAACRIELEGTVSASDRLFLARVNDRDELLFRGRLLGSTGSFVGREFHAGFFPRVYPLAEIAGERSPVLELRARGGLMHAPGIPPGTKVKMIDEHYPLWKILGAAILQLVSFAFLVCLCLYVHAGLRARLVDGWVYPRDELRWFLGGIGVYLLLRHEVSELLVPVLWPARAHLLAQRIAVLTAAWSASLLLLGSRFSDRSCIERPRSRAPMRPLRLATHAAYLFSLSAIATYPLLTERSFTSLLGAPLAPLLFAQGRALWETEWRRILKRSALAPLLFHLGLLLMPLGVLLSSADAMHGGSGTQRALETAAWMALLLAGARARSFLRSRETSHELALECRRILTRNSGAAPRLQAFCDFVADDWGAARISVISVEAGMGLVLASAGPEAIPDSAKEEPRKLGPFLRRVCKRGQMLYAPVAEELGKDLRNEGLKHSSLAIPLSENGVVRAVLCMMADEGERIPPSEAAQLEMLTDTLSLELLSCVGQRVADDRNAHLLEIARTADALAVENLDHWGHVQRESCGGDRVMLGGDFVPMDPFFAQLKSSPVLGRAWLSCRKEMRALWARTAAAFEFIPKDNRDDFWVVSPREFRNPVLRALGPEKAAALLAASLERHARAVVAKDRYSVLGYCGARLVIGSISLAPSPHGSGTSDVDADELAFLHELRARARAGETLFAGPASALAHAERARFCCRHRAWENVPGRQIFSILSVTADKKETRRLESQGGEKNRRIA